MKTMPTVRKLKPACKPLEKAFAEYFAGIGLVGEALRRSGWICKYANDIDPKKREIYLANYKKEDVYDPTDIWDTKTILKNLPTTPFLATASFPCIDLSLAGHYRGFDGDHSSTFFGFTKVMDALKSRRPKVLLIENVVGFLTAGGGKDFVSAVEALAELGYWIDSFVLDAKSFVPQSRPRVFLVGIQKGIDAPFLIRRQNGVLDAWSGLIGEATTLRPRIMQDIMRSVELKTGWVATPIKAPPQTKYHLEDFIQVKDDQEWWDEEQVKKHYLRLNARHKAVIDLAINSGGRIVATAYRRKRHDTTMMEVRFDGIAGCLRTPRGGSARQIVVVVESGKLRIRWMNALEYARLQGVGDFSLLENERQMLFGFGDAVCVPVIQWIDKCVLGPLFEFQSCQTT